jgi:hypothetical protein
VNLVLQFFKDKSIISAILILFTMEILLQFGCYKPFLKKSSYAQTVNYITDTSVSSLKTLKPNVLIIGTSIAYEGISLELLNEELKSNGIVIQSVAVPGSELIVQDLAIKKILLSENRIHTIIHINDLLFPWVDRVVLMDSTLSMIGELGRKDAINDIANDEYRTTWEDYSFLFLKFVAYRRDIGDFILYPNKRIKDIGKEFKKNKKIFYAYDNSYEESMSSYKISSLEDCIKKTIAGSLIPEGSNHYHMDAIYRTCSLALGSKLTFDKNQFTELYGKRLSNLYKYIRSKNIKIINIYPPVPTLLDNNQYSKRIEFWEKEYANILSESRYDLSDSIPFENNTNYYYDMVHLNKKGKEVFTKHLAEKLKQVTFSN